jgi:hypothetical protein
VLASNHAGGRREGVPVTEDNGRTRRSAAKERAMTLDDIDIEIAMCVKMQAEYEQSAQLEGAKLIPLETLRDKALQRGAGPDDT